MKTIPRILCVLLAVSTGGWRSVRADDERSSGDGTPRARALPDFLRVYDVDGNGVLSEEERQVADEVRTERLESSYESWDVNGDGVFSTDEQRAAREDLARRIEERRCERFDEADRNGDGSISPEEFRAIPAISRLDPAKVDSALDKLDADRDGLVSKDEFLAALRDIRPKPRVREGARPTRPAPAATAR